jgi:hypothetical protein
MKQIDEDFIRTSRVDKLTRESIPGNEWEKPLWVDYDWRSEEPKKSARGITFTPKDKVVDFNGRSAFNHFHGYQAREASKTSDWGFLL